MEKMLELVFKVLFYLIITVCCIDAAVLSGNRGMEVVNTVQLLLERFRKETGNADAKRIEWLLLDRRNVPAKYDRVPFTLVILHCKLVYQNPEIIYNIHFYQNIRIKNDFGDMDEDMNLTSSDCDENIFDFFDLEFMEIESNDNLQMTLENTVNLDIHVSVFMKLSRRECKRILTIKQ